MIGSGTVTGTQWGNYKFASKVRICKSETKLEDFLIKKNWERASDLTNRLARNVRCNMFTREITNRFTHDFRFYKFTMDIGNRFICNFRFHWFTCNIKNRFTSNFTFQRLTGDITNRFTGEVKLYGATRNNTKVSCATKECTDLWIMTSWITADWLLILETFFFLSGFSFMDADDS